MQRSNSAGATLSTPSQGLMGGAVPMAPRPARRPAILSAAARKAVLQRMLMFRQASLDRVSRLTGATPNEIKRYRHDLTNSDIPDMLLQRGAGLPFTRELPQGTLLYLIVRATRPQRIVETGVGPGYSTAWLLAGLEANGEGELVSLGPGPTQGRVVGVQEASVGQFVAPALRSRWTLVLGNTEAHLQDILGDGKGVDLFFYDNGPDVQRARFELRAAWSALTPRGVLLAHRIDANPAWAEFCRLQGLPLQVLNPGPPPMGGLEMRPGHLG